jgi:heat shock protein HslJ
MNKLVLVAALLSLFACTSTKNAKAPKQSDIDAAINKDNLLQKQSEGVDLFAKGSLPATWTLEIDFDKAIRFKSLDGANIVASSVKPIEMPGEKRISIATNTEYGKMQIDIYDQECSAANDQTKYEKKVVIQVNGKSYEGCGSFLYDVAINGKWTLQRWNGKQLSAGEFAKGLPLIQFDAAANKISGHDGCNQLFGEIEMRGNFITVKTLGSTKMACPGNKNEINIAAAISNKVISYSFKEGNLHLYLPDDTVAVFSK